MSFFFFLFAACQPFEAYDCTCAYTDDSAAAPYEYSTCTQDGETVEDDALSSCEADGSACEPCACDNVSAC